MVASGGKDGVVTLWNPQSWEIKKRLDTRGPDVTALSFSGDGRMLAVASSWRLQVFDTDSGRELLEASVPEFGATTDVAFSPDGTFLALANGTDIEYWRLPSRSRLLLRSRLRGLLPW